MREQHPSRRVQLAIAAAAVAVFSVSASGQSGQPAPPQSLVTISALQAAAQPPETVRRLTVDEAVSLSLEQNLGIRIERLNPQIQDVGIAQARSFWAPQVNTTFSKNSNTQPNTSVLAGTSTSLSSGTFFGSAGVNQLMPWGGSYAAAWNNSRLSTSDPSNTFNPRLQSQLQFNYTQPLLRNLKIDNVRQQLEISRILRQTSDVQLRATIVQTTRNVKNAYWDLAYQINNLAAQRQSLDLAKRLLADNEKRVQIGTMAPIDIVEAQSEVARNDESVIVAEAAIKQAEDRLRALIFDPAMPDFWTITIEPSDTAPFQAQAVDVDAAVRNALDQRTDLQQAKQSIAQSDVNMLYFRNQILPEVNAQVNYAALGIGGAQLQPINLFDPTGGGLGTRSVIAERSYGAALGDLFRNSYPAWSFAVTVGYPLGTSTQEANLARARLQYQQAQTQIKHLELQVATQVRDAARQVQTNQKRVESARAARVLAERRLEAEEKKFAAGIQTSFFVFNAQRDLAQARTNEVRAISDYNKSLVDFEAVQEVGTGGVGVTTAGSGAIQTGSAIVRQ